MEVSAREAVLSHCRLWNAADKDAWLALFDEDVIYEDPPGTVASQGRHVMSDHAWDRSFTDTKRWVLEPLLVIECGKEAQVHMRNHGAVAGMPVCVESIELWRVNEAGLVDSVRAFWEIPTDPGIAEHLSPNQWDG